ncbi:MAG: transposase [Chloroflexota bacterium]|nr:transposase [Chloroflexota bacterium]
MVLASQQPDWVVGFEDETWWSRLARPGLHAWSDDGPPRLVEPSVPRDDPDPKAMACYGLLLRPGRTSREELRLRFVGGRPVSPLTIQFLAWCCKALANLGRTTLVLARDNAAWHRSQLVRRWLREHNQRAHREGGARIVPCFLPTKSPWLNSIEPKWVHGKRRVVEPARLLTAREVEDRVCAAFGCPLTDHLVIPQEVA